MYIPTMLRRAGIGASLIAFFLAAPGIAAALKTDAATSTVAISFKQMGVPITASFKKFNAQIDFDSARPDAAKASVDIDMASFDLGDTEMNKEVAKKEWFNTARFPRASFTSSTLRRSENGNLNVTGKLSIKGTTTDVSFPMTVKKEGGNQVFEGTLPIKRLTFNIGEGEWKDTSIVADEVVIKFRIVNTQ